MTPEHGPASAETGGPPRLRLHLLRRLQALALMNALPMIAVVLILVGWWQGKIGFKLGHSAMSTVLAMVAAILAGCAVLAFCGWVILPIARWLRASPAWHFRHGSRWLWALPALGGWLAWLGTWLVCACCTLTALAVVAWGLWNLVMLAIQAGPSATAASSALPGAQ